MKSRPNYVMKSILLTLFFAVVSCGPDHLYESSNNNESATLGEVSSLVIRPGINMVSVEGVIDDSNVSEVKIYWNNKSKSITVPVSNNGEENTFTAEINNLQEKLYIFEVQTLDNQGESSEIVSGGAEVYGSSFLESLENRMIVSSELKDSNLNVYFEPLVLSSGILGTELVYTNNNEEEKEIFINTNKVELNISDFKSGSSFKHRSVFMSSPLALDTIYTDYVNYKPFVLPELQNASSPYIFAEYDGKRWGNLGAPWITNDAVKNHNGFGGYDNKTKMFDIESGWGAPAVTNGKVYQTVELDPATYQLKVTISGTNLNDTDDGGGHIVIASGNGLPDVENLDTATEVLGHERITGARVYYVEFTVNETSMVSVGELTTQSTAGRYCNINSWELLHIN